MIQYEEGATDAQQSEAHAVLEVVNLAYPGHPWAVRCEGGVIFIRHLGFGGSLNWGMNIRFNDVNHDAAVMKRQIIMMAGEWLERAGLVRGRDNGDEIVHVEGIPEKYQPHREIDRPVVIGDPEFRTEPRPQVRKLDG